MTCASKPNRIYVIPPSQDIVFAGRDAQARPSRQTGRAHAHRFVPAVAGRSAGGPEHRRHPVRHGLGRHPRAGGDQGGGRHHAGPGPAIGPERGHAPERDRRRVRGLRAAPRRDRGRADAARPAPLRGRRGGTRPRFFRRDGMARILALLLQTTGADFSAYKKTTLERRIARRMAVCRIETLEDYARHLEENKAETEALYNDCLISVTSFFRDGDVFEAAGRAGPSRLLRGPAGRRADPRLGARDARAARKRTRSPSASWRRRASGRATRRSRSSAPTSATARSRRRVPASISRTSPNTCRRSACGASSPRWTATTRSARPSARCACSRATT